MKSKEEIENTKQSTEMKELLERFKQDESALENELHKKAKNLLEENKVSDAWKILLSIN